MKIQLLSDLHLEVHPHWVATPAPGEPIHALVQIRYHSKPQPATVTAAKPQSTATGSRNRYGRICRANLTLWAGVRET